MITRGSDDVRKDIGLTYVKIISWPNGTRQLRINRRDQPPEDIEISNFEALQLAADLLKSIPYSKVQK